MAFDYDHPPHHSKSKLYVALELVTFGAVPLVSLNGRAETIQAALSYLLFALLGSILYLVGGALLYGSYGTLDIVLLSHKIHAEPETLVAAALMTTGLLAKTALFPLHLWLPPAHAGVPSPASAVLSGLVVKGPFFIVVQLWFDVMPGLPGFTAAQLPAALGAAAIVIGSVVALRQQRLKLLIAYSTLAQIGYLFLMFPLAFGAASARLESGGALAGGLLQAISHATAKAAMFMSAARAAGLRRTEWMVFCIDRAWQDYGTASRSRCTSVPHGLSRLWAKNRSSDGTFSSKRFGTY